MKKNFPYYLYWFVINTIRSNIVSRTFIELIAYSYYSIFRRGKYFIFRNKKYRYFYHLYNRTIASERIIEIPIAYGIIKNFEGKQILEIGNVLSHYFDITPPHYILDKYEKGNGVINQDVVNFKTNKKYDLIISVSTMEHVGWSYGEKKDSQKFLKSIKNLQKYVAPRGMMLITIPVDYREDLFNLIKNKKMSFNKEYFMKRVSFWNEWKKVSRKEALSEIKYDTYYANANSIYIGIYKNE